MKLKSRFSALAASGLLLSLTALQANAGLIVFDDILVGPTPDSSPDGVTGGYLTADVSNITGGVEITLELFVDYPEEFVTTIYFSLDQSIGTQSDPGTSPALTIDTCNAASSSPANTGPWQLCVSFAPSDHVAQPTSVTFQVLAAGLDESSFVANAAGWYAVAHVQGIQPDCSSWVGAYSGSGQVPPGGGGECAQVPEPNTLSLFGLGIVALLGAGIVNGRRQSGARA